MMTFIDLLSVLGAAYLLLLLWEPPRLALHQELLGWLATWFQGVSFGSYTLSFADVLLALLMLFVVLGLTRVIRSLLEHRLLPQTRMGIGARTAVSSSVGYVGVLLAVLISLSTLGIDLSKLALIAGALSVGIGFGLQNIVNNFVSGLILLFEQPVKIGDWVVVGTLEGKVKQINVRATEIETFDRASVIIPNADLLQTSVTNWTHDSSFGRFGINVGVGYDSDPEQVERILLDCALSHTLVLTWPEPFARFIEFGDSSLDFKLYIYVDDIEGRMTIGSDIRKSILREFRAAGIEIPFPQRVVSVNRLDAGLGED
jgi:small-conductance mechanosensitive channel